MDLIKRVSQNDVELTSISLMKKKLGNEWAKNMSEALKMNTVLTSIHLGYNYIGIEGVSRETLKG